VVNGKLHDHPITEVLDHRVPVFSPAIDELVRKISEYVSNHRLYELFDWFRPPPEAEFEAQLRAKLLELEADARGAWMGTEE